MTDVNEPKHDPRSSLSDLALQLERDFAIECESREMFVARLENMQTNGDTWLTIVAVLALMNDCDMLAQLSNVEIGSDTRSPQLIFTTRLATNLKG